MKNSRIVLKPIGLVLNKTRIEISPCWQESLSGIDDFSHIVVLFWMDRVSRNKRRIKKVKPCTTNRLKGVLSTRMPFRPNPIGLSIVELVGRKKNILKVQEIDALEGTPVLDIKPYTGHPKDLVYQCRAPSWITGKRRKNK